MKMKNTNQLGFTILELMIATSVFAVILLVCSAMLLQIGRLYYRGVNASRTQEVARNVVEDISRRVQFTTNDLYVDTDSFGGVAVTSYCIGATRYTVAEDIRVVPGAAGFDPGAHTGPRALWKDVNPDQASDTCNTLDFVTSQPAQGEELLGENMRIGEMCIGLELISPPGVASASSMCEVSTAQADDQHGGVTINLSVIYGEQDLILYEDGVPNGCLNQAGSQWCASSRLRTQVFRRL